MLFLVHILVPAIIYIFTVMTDESSVHSTMWAVDTRFASGVMLHVSLRWKRRDAIRLGSAWLVFHVIVLNGVNALFFH